MTKHVIDRRNPESLMIHNVDPTVDDSLFATLDKNTFRKILLWGKKLGVADLAFQADMPVIAKIDNMLYPITKVELSPGIIKQIINIIYDLKPGDDSAYLRIMSGDETNCGYHFYSGKEGEVKTGVRYRINHIRDDENSLSLRARLNTDEIHKLEAIGQSPDGVIYRNMFKMKGGVFITGSVGSGKTTLIYACLRHFVENDPRHAFIDTFENPVEANLKRVVIQGQHYSKMVNQCPVPLGVKGFKQAVQEMLRRNTDIGLLGEIRTPEEAEGMVEALKATGKLMMATLHTDTVGMTISRIIEMLYSDNPARMKSLVSELINGTNMIVSQKLLATVDRKRTAVNEVLVFTNELKKKLSKLEIYEIPEAINKIMIDSGDTMVDKAKVLLEDGKISQTVFDEFAESFSY